MTLVERLRSTKPDQPGWWMIERDDGKTRPLYLTQPGGAGGWSADWREGFKFSERENAEQQFEFWHSAYGHVRSHGMMAEYYNPDGPEAVDLIEALSGALRRLRYWFMGYAANFETDVAEEIALIDAALASVDRSPQGGDRETGRHAKHESAVPSEASADAPPSGPSLQTPQGGDS